MISKSKLLFVGIGLSVLAYSCKEAKKEEAKPSAKPSGKVDAFIVSPAVLNNRIEVPGSLSPFEETNIQPEISEKVTGIYFKEGATVTQGSVMIKLSDADLQAQLKKLEVQLAIAQKTEQRQSELLKINGISQQDYDMSLLNVKNLEADINILKTSIAKTVIKAPFTGKAGLRNISIGAYVNPQTIITTLRQVNQLKLTFTVPERYSAKMKPGELVRFTLDGENKPFSATVLATENDISEDTRSMKVKATVNGSSDKLFAGAFAKVVMELGKNETALMIPTQSIIPQARGKKVMAVRNGMASLETVTTGARDTAMVEITSGLKAGDTVLVSGLLTTRPGTKVQLNQVKQKGN